MVRYQPGHAFWLYSLHHRLKYGPHPRPGLARWFDPFNSLVPLVAATGFDVARAQLGFKTSAMLVLASKPNSVMTLPPLKKGESRTRE
jgi:hypothetical protein